MSVFAFYVSLVFLRHRRAWEPPGYRASALPEGDPSPESRRAGEMKAWNSQTRFTSQHHTGDGGDRRQPGPTQVLAMCLSIRARDVHGVGPLRGVRHPSEPLAACMMPGAHWLRATMQV